MRKVPLRTYIGAAGKIKARSLCQFKHSLHVCTPSKAVSEQDQERNTRVYLEREVMHIFSHDV